MPDQAVAAVIALHNGGEFIEDALNSVFAQTMPPASVIVVDDGSTDDGPEIVERLAKSRGVTLIRKQNGGQSSARNLGISASSTPLIALLDQDDIWYPHHLEALSAPFRLSRSKRLGWAYSNVDQIDREGRLVQPRVLDSIPGVEHPKRTLLGCLRTDMFALPSATLIDRLAFETVGGFDEHLVGYEDDDLFLRMFRLDFDNLYLPEPLSRWRVFAGSASHSIAMARSRMIFFRKWRAILGDASEACIRDGLAQRFFRVALANYHLALRTDDREAQDVALETMRALSRFVRARIGLPARLLLPLANILGVPRIGRAAVRTVPLARMAWHLISR